MGTGKNPAKTPAGKASRSSSGKSSSKSNISAAPSSARGGVDVFPVGNRFKKTAHRNHLIVGADGARSLARQAVLSDPSSVCYNGEHHSWRWKFLSVKPDFEEGPYSAMNQSGFFSTPNGGGGWWYIHPYKRIHLLTFFTSQNITASQNPRGLETEAAVQQFLTNVLGNVSIKNSVAEAAKTYLAAKPSTQYIFKMSKYHHSAGKVVLVGDAAHTMSSALGQGMTCGITDVCCLFECLSKRNWTDIPTALSEYSEERVPEGNAITDLNYVSPFRRKHPVMFFLFQTLQKKIFGLPTLQEVVNTGYYKSALKRQVVNYIYFVNI